MIWNLYHLVIRDFWLRYQVEGYTEEIVHNFEQRLEMIFGRQVNRVHTLDFKGLTSDMRQDLAERLRMVYTGDDGQEIFMSHAWRRQFILALGLHTAEEMAEDGFGAYWVGSERVIPDKGDIIGYWIKISFDREFLRSAPSYTYIRDSMQRLCHRLISYSIFERGQTPEMIRDDWAWVAKGAERQPVAATTALGDVMDALDVDEGAQAVSAPIHAPPLPPQVVGRTMPHRLGRLEEEI
uniref:Uncharacterized protein n=1 Tax=Tanacetum cinerariifolium TaxID=118510 RepID=A0A6L2KH31_TANCI|nr:hypothetical protein [Tanacetum cinerariifolium]